MRYDEQKRSPNNEVEKVPSAPSRFYGLLDFPVSGDTTAAEFGYMILSRWARAACWHMPKETVVAHLRNLALFLENEDQ